MKLAAAAVRAAVGVVAAAVVAANAQAPSDTGIIFETKINPNAGSFLGRTADEMELTIVVDLAKTGEFAFLEARCEMSDRDGNYIASDWTVIPRDNFKPHQGTTVRYFSRGVVMESGSSEARCIGVIEK